MISNKIPKSLCKRSDCNTCNYIYSNGDKCVCINKNKLPDSHSLSDVSYSETTVCKKCNHLTPHSLCDKCGHEYKKHRAICNSAFYIKKNDKILCMMCGKEKSKHNKMGCKQCDKEYIQNVKLLLEDYNNSESLFYLLPLDMIKVIISFL